MKEQKDKTEDKILDAAHEVFLRKGMEGARMQEIADEAGINKALLHYYFRSKSKLFEAIFGKVLRRAFPDLRDFLVSGRPLHEKIDVFVDTYIDLMMKNPYLPVFILQEINRDPKMLANVIRSNVMEPSSIFDALSAEFHKAGVNVSDPRHLMVNIIALSVFPFAARPLLQQVMFGNNQQAYRQFLDERKLVVKEVIHRSIGWS